MKKEQKKLNQFMIVACSQAGLLALLIIFAIIYIVNVNRTLTFEEQIDNLLSPKTEPFGILIVICFSLYLAMSIGSSIALMVLQWESEWSINNKILLGSLTLFLGFITILIFVLLGKKNLKNIKTNQNHHNYYNDFPNETELDKTLEMIHNKKIEKNNY